MLFKANVNPDLPTGTVTFLFTDIEGSTKLSQEYADDLPALLERHQGILKQAIEAHHGFVFQVVGDSFSVAFDSAANALKAASEAQRLLYHEAWFPAPIKVRMGIHTGTAQLANDSSIEGPYSGYTTLALTQRIMSAAYGGQILLSQITRDLVWGQLPPEVSLLDMGEHRLKDVKHTLHLYQVAGADLPTGFPPLKSLESFPHNLPIQLTSFVGREREITEAKQLLSNAHLLTLIGPGGTGKTRLALRVAGDLLSSFKDGVWLAELAPLADPSLISQAIAGVFELRELPNIPMVNIITDYLRAKELLLILDNCEHLIEACAQISESLLRNCPRLKIIASSREALGIAGEMVYRVPSLSLPDPAQVRSEALLEAESIRLFVDRATAAQSRFGLTDQNAAFVAQICRRLDGIPLALELAAARITVFSPEQITARLDNRFKLLTGGSRTALPRQQTLRAMIDWSYDLLSGEEQALLRQLSVFSGGWTFEAAESVCSNLDTLNLLTQLVNKSLVMVDAGEASTRYRLLETIRQYARDKLLEAGESERVRNRHLDFFLKFAEEAEAYMNGPLEMKWRILLDTEYDNLRTAIEWAIENDVEKDLRLGGALHVFWERHGYEVEGRRLITEALARVQVLSPVEAESTRERITIQAKALNALGLLCFGQGDNLGCLRALEESASLSRPIGEKSLLSQALSYTGMARAFLGERETAYTAAQEAITLAREAGNKILLGTTLINMVGVMAVAFRDVSPLRGYGDEGIRYLRESGSHWALAMTVFGFGLFMSTQGNYAEARSQFEACLPLFTELRDRHRLAMVQSELGHLERRQGHFAQARSIYRETIREWQRAGHRAAIAHQLECFAFLAKVQEDTERAACLFGAAEILRENISIPMTPVEHFEYEREVSDLRRNMDEAAFSKAWAEGRAMTMESAIEYAVEDIHS
ncbi:MAG TPA: adenylate/guanylate cyclase domain-containing protein [Anaerolineales bacterium]|nr:adenylate/guanylate cyclase domain-containing protein [Anaerolineales bacterium]